MDLLGALRLCANVPGQFAIEASLHGADTITELCQPGGRLYEARRAVVESCAASEHLKLVAPAGALYAFPGITGAAAESFDDHTFALELLETQDVLVVPGSSFNVPYRNHRSEEHTSELQSLMRISYAVFCLKKKKNKTIKKKTIKSINRIH